MAAAMCRCTLAGRPQFLLRPHLLAPERFTACNVTYRLQYSNRLVADPSGARPIKQHNPQGPIAPRQFCLLEGGSIASGFKPVRKKLLGPSVEGYLGTGTKGSRPRDLTTSAAVQSGASSNTEVAGRSTDESEEVEGVKVKHRYFSNGGVRIHYVEAGDPGGELVVLLHGFPSFWYSWVYQIKPLVDAGYHVVIPDMRGYNLSDKPPSVPDYGRQPCLSDVKLLIEKNGSGRPAVLIAHDWGGALAWHFVRSHPHLVSRLVTLNIPETSTFAEALKSNKAQRKKSWYIAFFQIPLLPEWLLSRKNYQNLKAALGGSKRSEELLRRHVDAFSRPGALTASINYYRAAFRGHWASPEDTPGRVDLPVKVIWGDNDVALETEMATPPKHLVPNQEVVILPGVSHWCMWDEPELVNTEILTFLAKGAI